MRTLFLILAVAFVPFLPAQAQNYVGIDDGNEDGFIYGIGADFSLNYNSSLRLEYVESDLDGAESDRLSFGTIYRF